MLIIIKIKVVVGLLIKLILIKIKFEDLLLNILTIKMKYFIKKNNLEKLNYQNTWNNVNQNLLNIINEN